MIELIRGLCKSLLRRFSIPTCMFLFVIAFFLTIFVLIFERTSEVFQPKHRMFVFCTISENIKQYEDVSFDRDVDLRIIAIVYDRATSLQRLLESLNQAHFYGDSIVLHVWIDRSKNGTIDSRTYKVARDFIFKHGQYYVHNQTCHVGIYGQWIGTWYPRNGSSEFAVIFEDDLTVSPYFYKWLKVVHRKFDYRPDINGYSLQGISIKHGIDQDGFLDINKTHKAFLYPILGTWGFSPNNRNWRAFSDWYLKVRRNASFQPYVEGIRPSVWYQEQLANGQHDRMWSMWFIYYAWMKKVYTVYSNFHGIRHSMEDRVLETNLVLNNVKDEDFLANDCNGDVNLEYQEREFRVYLKVPFIPCKYCREWICKGSFDPLYILHRMEI